MSNWAFSSGVELLNSRFSCGVVGQSQWDYIISCPVDWLPPDDSLAEITADGSYVKVYGRLSLHILGSESQSLYTNT